MTSSIANADVAPESLYVATRRADYITRVSDAVRAMRSNCDPSEAVELLRETASRIGVEAAIFMSFMCDGDSTDAYHFVLACDPTSLHRSQEATPASWVAYARRYSEPLRSSDAPHLPDTAQECIEYAHRLGFRSAMIVPVPCRGDLSRLSVLCLGSSQSGFFDDDGYAVLKMVARSVAMEMHEWWLERLRDHLVETTSVTPEDVALLDHERQGHTTKMIARRLGVSTGAVDSRFQRVIAKLGVANRRAAARRAAEYGLI